MKFLSVSAGYPGSVHDARILRNSWLFNASKNEDVLAAPQRLLHENITLKPYLEGDAIYPLSRWLMKPLPYSKNIAEDKKAFNPALSQARVSIERAFGVLKGR